MTRTSDSHLSLTAAFPVRYAASLPVPRIQPYLDVPGTESFFCGGPMRNPHCTTQALFKRCDVIKGSASSSPRRSFLFPSKSSIREAPSYRPPSGTGEVRILWDSCNVNRSNHCTLRVHVKGGEITHVETDNTGDERYGMQQIRACPLDRSMRQRIHAEQRIPYPLYRVATGWKEVRAHQMGGSLRGDRTGAARNHRHLRQRGRPSELRHGCDRQYHRQKSASGRYARCPAHESCRRLQTVVRVAAANGTFPTARRSLPPLRKKMTKCDFCRDYLE